MRSGPTDLPPVLPIDFKRAFQNIEKLRFLVPMEWHYNCWRHCAANETDPINDFIGWSKELKKHTGDAKYLLTVVFSTTTSRCCQHLYFSLNCLHKYPEKSLSQAAKDSFRRHCDRAVLRTPN